MTGRAWMAARVAMALALMAMFYLLALGISCGLLWLAYADVVHMRRVHVKVVVFCVLGAGAILWSILPRPDKFEPPGPRVLPAEEPDLFHAIKDTAGATRQEMPAEVYVVNEVNAFVTQRGGVMGFGSRRVMGLGVPLMQALTVQEFKAVLAHEFGHYHAGDVKLGPWIYQTRAAMGRTIEHLDGNILQKIFLWYGQLFLRLTHAVSRRQEFIADEVAARAAGAGVMISGLRKVHAAALAFQGYWQSEVAPLLGSGYVPPVSHGFSRFMTTPRVARDLDDAVKREEAEGETDPYDTHPSLRDRVAALSTQPMGEAGDVRPATVLLRRLARWERQLLGAIVDDNWARSLKAIEWEKVPEAVFIPAWREMAAKHVALLRDLRLDALPATAALAERGTALVDAGETLTVDEKAYRMSQVIAGAACLALLARGWTLVTAPGDEIAFNKSGRELRPFTDILAMAAGTLTAAEWKQRCADAGLSDVPLVGAADTFAA
jgi:heat shock protein HtpX